MAGKRPNRIHDTGAADKEHKYESATKSDQLGFLNATASGRIMRRATGVRLCNSVSVIRAMRNARPPHDPDAWRFAYRHSSRNAAPTPMSTIVQTQKPLARNVVTSDGRSKKAAIRNTGPLIAQ